MQAPHSSSSARPAVAGIKRPRARRDETGEAAEADALIPDDMLPLQHLEKYHRRTSDARQPDRPAPLLSHLDQDGGIRAVGDALELNTGSRHLPFADELAAPPLPKLPPAPPGRDSPDVEPSNRMQEAIQKN